MSTTKLNVALLTTPKKLRSGRISQVTERVITSGTSGGGGTVDLTGLMKLTSPTEQVVDSLVTVTKDFKAFNIYEGGVKLSDKYVTPTGLETRIAALVDAAPITLDTLNELANALGDDPNFATTITNLIATKAPIDNPVFTGIPKVGSNVMYHAGNLNKSDIDFKARGIESNYLVTSQFILFNNEYKTFLDVFNSSEQSAFTTNVTRATDGFSLAKTVLSDNNYSISFASSNHTPYNIYHAGNSNLSTVNWLAKDLTAAGTLQSSTYSGTGLTASGWQIDNDGNANIKSLTVRELARFYELEVDKIRCINGGLAITPANGIVSKISGSTLFFDEVPQFVVGDIVRAQKWTNGVRGFKAPITAIDTIAKSVTLGTFITGDLSQIKIGDEIIVWNSTVGGRDGLIYMSANDAGSPFIDVVKNEITKLRIGNIGGMLYNGVNIPANTMGYFADGDVYIKNGHFTGEVTITGSGGNIASKEDVANAKEESISTATANATDIADAAKEEAIDAGHTITSRMIGSLTNSLGTLAYQSKVEAAQLGTTLIQGGYIRTDCLNVNDIFAKQATIGGWYINANQLYSGTNGAGNTPMIRLSTANIGGGDIYYGSRILEGLSLTWHQSNNAGHIVFGQIAASGTTLRDNFKGLQMMSWDGLEYFCMSANAGLSGSKEVYNRIAGWGFDNWHLWNNNIELRSDGIIRHNADKWRFNNDGSWQLAGGNLYGDGAGNITGNNCTFNNGTFNGTINAGAGKIGGFNIESNQLTSSTPICNFSINSNEGYLSIAGVLQYGAGSAKVGFNTTNNTSSVARFISGKDELQSSFTNAAAVYAEGVKILPDNYYRTAILTKGNIVSNHSCIGSGINHILLQGQAQTQLYLSFGTHFLINNDRNSGSVILPTLDIVTHTLGIIESTTIKDFCVRISICNKFSSYPFSLWSNDSFVMHGFKGEVISKQPFPTGAQADIDLYRVGNETWAQFVNWHA